jgi:hypothetical protein
MSPFTGGLLIGLLLGGMVGVVVMSCLIAGRPMLDEWRRERHE